MDGQGGKKDEPVRFIHDRFSHFKIEGNGRIAGNKRIIG